MRSFACHLVPVLALFALAACYDDHGRGRGAGDAGPTPPPPLDAGTAPPPEPPPPEPPPPGCGLVPADFACTDTEMGTLPVGVPYALPVYFGDGERCYCGERLDCVAAITAPGVLDLTTYQCNDLPCEACFPYVQGRCELPPLSAGRWHVRVNGASAFEIEAADVSPFVPTDACLTRPNDALECGYEWPPRPEQSDQICHPGEARAGAPIRVRVTDFCHACGALWGPCVVTQSGSSIVVQPQSVTSSCDVDCPSVCTLSEASCWIPPLEPGEYTVSLLGLPGTTRLTVVPEGRPPRSGDACNSIPED